MAGKWMRWAAMGALLAATGCCRFCERWCGPSPTAAAYPHCVPCTPCCVPCCPPGTAPAHYQPQQPVPGQGTGWQRTYTQPVSGQNCCE
jgi:hypothetical protein